MDPIQAGLSRRVSCRNSFAFFVMIILLQGTLAYTQFAAAGTTPALLPFLAGMGFLALQLLAYLTLTLMLGSLFSSSIPVVGIAVALLFGQPLLAEIAAFGAWLPGTSRSTYVVPILTQPCQTASGSIY